MLHPVHDESIVGFLGSPLRNLWCREGNIHCYLVKSVIRGQLLISNIYNVNRQDNVYRVENPARTGDFREFMNELEFAAYRRNFQTIKFVSIVNEFLGEVLERRKYRPLPCTGFGLPIQDYELDLSVRFGRKIA